MATEGDEGAALFVRRSGPLGESLRPGLTLSGWSEAYCARSLASPRPEIITIQQGRSCPWHHSLVSNGHLLAGVETLPAQYPTCRVGRNGLSPYDVNVAIFFPSLPAVGRLRMALRNSYWRLFKSLVPESTEPGCQGLTM
ncbi:hypothetical protein VTK73DRAFT_9016 [Phialemonium thermophilum]|uniref:Uncharacterized protein n=1 Tax=Phialemonium thermophilum TaxID=223376 RepID=A0ABR3W5Q1_9PEZI